VVSVDPSSSWKAQLSMGDRGANHYARFSTLSVIGPSMTRVTLAHPFGWRISVRGV
jgi:hypothetical protein